MTSVKATSKKQQFGSHRQKQERKHFENIGTSQVSLRQNPTKSERESLSDWEDAV